MRQSMSWRAARIRPCCPACWRLTVEVLRDFRHADAVDALLAALADDDENVRDTAWRSLRDLTGQKLAFDATASKDARGKAAAKWQEWCGTARATFGS